FEAAGALEWIYDHVAREPRSPLALVPELPPALAELVLKLLAKMPEDRYQTARGLLFDLERCAAAQRRDGRIEPFVLGERDVAEQPRFPEKVYGRDREVGALFQAFERVVSTGKVELFLVAGHPGVGKSTLVSELRPAALRSRALFLSGKFDQRASSIPYSTLVQAFTRVVLELLGEEEEHARSWSALLKEALGGEAKLIVDVIPPLRLLLGEPPPLVEAPLLDAELRFRRVFLDFLGVFARPERPLVLFLDDLQWADMASLRLLEEIATDPDTHYLLLVGAYRDGEVDTQHPLAQAMERLRKTAIPVTEMVLKPLGTEHMIALVADTLRLDRERVRPLAELVCDKTGGNPFFVIQFLSSLHQERLLWLDESTLEWQWDVGRIEERRYTDNVIDFMLGRLAGLPAETQGALKIAACIGSECDLPILARVYGSSEERTLGHLRQALEEGLVLQTRGRIVFAHDRVQQAAYALLEPERRSQTHLQIGRVLFESTPPERTQDRLFDIASQFELGVSGMKDQPERLLVAELNLRAGRKAKAASAYELAARYLAVGQALLPADAWETHYDLTFATHLERARCETLSQRFEEAERLIQELLGHAHEAVDQLEVAALRIDVAVVQKAPDKALQIAIAACSRWLGVDLELHPSEDELRRFVEETRSQLGDRPIEELARLPETTNAAVKAGIELFSKTMPAAYYVDLRLHDLMSATIVRLSMEHGNSEISPHGYSTFGGALGRLFERWDEAYRYGEVAAAIAEQRGPAPSPGKGSSYFTTGVLINGWIRPIREVIPLIRRSFAEAQACGDINIASFAALVTVDFSFSAGEILADLATEAEHSLEYTRRVQQYLQGYLADILQVVRRLRGQPLDPLVANDASRTAPTGAETQHPWFRFQHQACRAIEHFVFGEYDQASAAAECYRTLAQLGSIAPVAHAWYIAALAYSCHFDDAPASERSKLREWVGDLEWHHRVWERRCAETFRNRRALISAEAARIDGRDAEAMRLYDEAITSSRSGGFVQNEAIAAELAARFCRMRGLSVMAEAYLQRARACYGRWGAEAKVDQLDRLYSSLRPLEAPGPSATLAVRPEQLDLVSVLKASQTISSEIELDKLVRTLLETVLLQSGAQRAVLVLEEGGKLFVKAHAELEPSGVSRTSPEQETLELKEYSALAPVSLLRYVELTREREILFGSAAPGPVEDEYLVRNRPQSALCLPILKQGKVLGILYLENRITAGAFTAERLAALEVLATQSAISVENALLLT
ncbi:MAG TPA: AAA family ATPase, partial [Polyangiaceae bacterium]